MGNAINTMLAAVLLSQYSSGCLVSFQTTKGNATNIISALQKPPYFTVLRDQFNVLPSEPELTSGFQEWLEQLGTLHPTDSKGTIIWPVFPRRDHDSSSTFSELSGECSPHTDETFRIKPAQVVALAMVHPASEGGESVLIAADDILKHLEPWAELVLRTNDVPFGTPKSFRTDPSKQEVVWAKILDGDSIRWRDDAVLPSMVREEETRFAINALHEAVDKAARTELHLGAGDILLLRNDLMLHSRNHFDDEQRRLLRGRLDLCPLE